MYRLLRFIDNETNTAPDYEVVLELDKFEESEEILNKFIKVCKEKNLPYSDGYYDYMVIEYAYSMFLMNLKECIRMVKFLLVNTILLSRT